MFEFAASYSEAVFCCSVAYHELNQRVGKTFQALQLSLIVDAITDLTNSEMFCPGLFSNINQNAIVEMKRIHTGRGVFL